MINFRFHLASLIAIFLALALGVVVGAGVIDRGVVDTLNARLDSVERESNRIKDENGVLTGENGELAGAITAGQCLSVENRMLGDDLAVVAIRGVDDDSVKRTLDVAHCAGANIDGVLWLEGKWALANDDDAKAMADLLGSTSRKPGTLRTMAWKQLAERLKAGSAAGDSSTDLLAAMEDAGFVKLDTVGEGGATIAQFPTRGASTLLVVGGDADMPDKDVVMPGAAAIAGAGIPLVVGEVYVKKPDGPGRGNALAPVRDGDLANKVSTVANLDRPQGPLTAVLALAALLRIPARVGHYGLTGDKLPDVSQ